MISRPPRHPFPTQAPGRRPGAGPTFRLPFILLALVVPLLATPAGTLAGLSGPPGATAANHSAPGTPPVTAPPVTAPPGRFDDTALRRPDDGSAPPAGRPGGNGAPAAPDAATASGYDLPRVLLALAAVVGLIFLLRWTARRFFGLPSARHSSQAVQVLSRTVLSPRQQLLLVKVGRRVIVAADGGAQVSALSEITDPDEVAALLGQLRSEKDANPLAVSPAKAFGTLLARLKKGDTPSDAAGPTPGEDIDNDAGTVGDDADDADAEEVEAGSDEGGSVHPAGRAGPGLYGPPGRAVARAGPAGADSNVVAATRQELSGLMEKVRLVSDQFGRGKER